ncbi:MAG: glycosyltransferase family 2 protein, partial [Lachnospiraceae bacterium]
IIIVDNASTDGSVEYLRENHPELKVIVQAKNYGFSHAVNTGIRSCSTPYVILLNNDTVVDPNFIKELLVTIHRHKKVFSVSSKMIQLHHPELIDSAGDLYTLLGWGICRGVGRSIQNYTKSGTIFSACAGAAIYRRSFFQKIGFFDEAHFAYLEDIDIGYRAKIYGYQNLYCPTALVYHVGSGTSGSKYNDFKVGLSARNSIYLNYKNMPFLQLVINALPLLTGYIIKYFFFQKKGFAKAYQKGIYEGIHTLSACKKVPFSIKHLPHYFNIEWELLQNTFAYTVDWVKRKLSTD